MKKCTKLYQTIISIIQYGQTVSTDDEDTGSFLCAHDPYFTLIPEPEIDTELLTVTENEFEEVLNDTIAENDGFVAPNYDYVTTLAPMKTVEDMDGDNFINARIRPFHDTDQVCKNIGHPSTELIFSHGPETLLVLVSMIFHLVNV